MFQTAFQRFAFQKNAFQIYDPSPDTTVPDGGYWTKKEYERILKLQKKIAERNRKLEQAIKDANASRRQAFRNLIDPKPVAKVKQSKVQLKQEVKADIPLAETKDLQRSISYLEAQRENILAAVAYRQEFARLQQHLRVLEAKRLEELDDEESVLLLLH